MAYQGPHDIKEVACQLKKHRVDKIRTRMKNSIGFKFTSGGIHTNHVSQSVVVNLLRKTPEWSGYGDIFILQFWKGDLIQGVLLDHNFNSPKPANAYRHWQQPAWRKFETQQREERGKSSALQLADKVYISRNKRGKPARDHSPFAGRSHEFFIDSFPAGLALFCAVGLAGKYCVPQNTSEFQVTLLY